MAIKLHMQEPSEVRFGISGGDSENFNMRDLVQVVESESYEDLTDKPSINGVELIGDKSTEDLLIDVGVTSWNGQTGDVTYTPPAVPVQSVNGKVGDVVLTAGDVGALPVNTPIPTKTSDLDNDSGYITGITSTDVTSALGFTPYNATNPNGYVNATQAANAAPVQSVNGQTGAVVLDADDVGALPDDTTYVGSVSVTPNLTSGTKVGSIDVDGTSTDLYAPTNTDTKVTQTATTTTDYTYWRGLCVGNSAVQSESGGFSTVTDTVRTFNNIRVQPSTGTIKATVFKGDLTGNVTGTASGNLKVGDNVSSLANDSGYITGITSGDVTTALGYTPYDSSNPSGYITGINSGDVTTALGFTPYDASNPSGYVDSVGAASAAPVQSVNGSTGSVSLGAADVSALPDDTKYAASPAVGGSATYANGIHYAAVDNTSTSTAFTATIPGITEYYDGLTVMLYNGKVTSASNFTININNLGAYGSYSNMTLGNPVTPTNPTRDTTIFNINYSMLFTYCSHIGGGSTAGWIGYRGYDANTNTIGYQLRTNNTVRKVTDKTRYYRLLFSSADDTKWVPANTQYDNSATSVKTVNTRSINPFGEIVYLGSTTSYAADANMSATTVWQQYNLTLGYSFNNTGAALTLTSQKPVYVKCAPQSDGSAIMDSTTPIVQTLPSTDDGKIYIWLGTAYSATQIELTMNHPVYYYKNGAIRLWTNLPIYNGGVI